MRAGSASPLRIGIACGVLMLASAAAPAHAQSVRLRGVVTDTAGTPINDADVRVVGHPYLTRTDDEGRFAFNFLPEGPVLLSFRRLGFTPLEVAVGAASDSAIHFVMREAPSRLPAVTASANKTRLRMGIQGFHERRTKGIGTFVTREEILARPNASRPTDILRTASGVRVVYASGGSGIRFSSTVGMRRDCMPMMWIDGQRAPGMEIDQVSLQDIEGIELYSGPSTTPMQFSYSPSGTTCGTIVLWTRNPG